MDETEQPDEALRAAYRSLPPEGPGPALDAAVLGAARQGVARRSHNWRVPVSLAAVLVLSVAVTLRVAEEQPEIRTAPPSPPASGEITKPVVPGPDSKADAAVAGPAPQAKTRVRPETSSIGRAAKPVPSAPEKEEANVPAAPAFVPSPPADATEQRQAAAPPAAPAPATEQAAGLAAQSGARADRRAPMMAKRSAEAPNLASDAPPLSAEAWLDRIIELRASARYKEADESYAEFRRRFPDFPIPPEKLQKIAPPR